MSIIHPIRNCGPLMPKICIMHLEYPHGYNYRNPSLGLATKARGCKVAGQVGDPGALHMLLGVQRV